MEDLGEGTRSKVVLPGFLHIIDLDDGLTVSADVCNTRLQMRSAH